MRVKICENETNKVANFSLLNTDTDRAIKILHRKKKDKKLLSKGYCLYYSTPLFSIVRINSSAKKSSKLKCEFDGNGIIMSFQRKGMTSCVINRTKRNMQERQNNIFLFTNKFVRCLLTEADCFRIVLSKTYVKALSELYPEAMAPLIDACEKSENSVFDYSHLNTTLEMEQIIKNIENLLLQPEEGKEMLIEAKIRELLYAQIMQYLKALDKKDLKIEKYRGHMKMACEYVERNVQELPSLHDIAKSVGVCDTILKIAFKYFYGKTVFEYFNEYRLNKSCVFLQNSSYSISEVSFLVGYKHLSHFSSAFKQKYGITPIEYRTENIEAFSSAKNI